MSVTGGWPRRLRRAIWFVAAAVLAVQTVVIALNLHHRAGPWDLEAEYGYPALLDTALLAAGSLCCLACFAAAAVHPQAVGRRWSWLAAGLVLAWLFVDGGWMVHERVVPALQPWLDRRFGVTAPPWFWLVPYAPLLGLGALAILSVTELIFRRDRVAGAACALGLVCWGGAVLTEPVGLELWQGSHPSLYTAAVVVEESLEVAGALGILVGVALYGAGAWEAAPAPEERGVAAGAGSR